MVDVAHYANSYATRAQLRAGIEFYRALPANEKLNSAQRNAECLDVPIVPGWRRQIFRQTFAENGGRYACARL
jgi:hypothetical protein